MVAKKQKAKIAGIKDDRENCDSCGGSGRLKKGNVACSACGGSGKKKKK